MEQKALTWAVVVVQWSASLPSTPTIRVRFLLMTNILYEKTKINEKEAGVGPSLKKSFNSLIVICSKVFIGDDGDLF